MRLTARRLLFVVTMAFVASRLVLLAEARGAAVVAFATLQVTLVSLGAWLVHLTLHELAHWAMAVRQGFQVRGVRFAFLAIDFTGTAVTFRLGRDLGGGVSSLPRGTERLWQRLRRVAAAGPLMTAVVTLVTFFWWRAHAASVATMSGVFLVMGGFTLITALIPGAVLPTPPASGTDLEQLLQPRRVKAHWLNAAALQAVLDGQRMRDAVDPRLAESLLPTHGAVEGLDLGVALALLDAGETKRGRDRLVAMVERFDDDTPEWIKTDTFNQLGALSALEGDVVHAQACLHEVRATQRFEWYQGLLEACIARARGEATGPALARWFEGVNASPAKRFALAGNEWLLEALGANRAASGT